jgi:radical SAM superfamily enzyme YgiQ (UPF0313 family)
MRISILIPSSKFSKNVARDLIYGCWCKGKRIAGIKFPPLSLLSVGTVLKNENRKADLIDAGAMNLSLNDLKKIISKYEIVIMLTSSMTLNEDASVLAELKKVNKNLKSMVFGGHVTAEPKSTLVREGIDIVVRGEAEYIIRDLARAMERKDESWKVVRGISYMEDSEYRENPNYPHIQNLDELPIPDRSMLPKEVHYFNPVVKRMPYTTMFTSRGCPGKCTFCSSPSFYGKAIRYRSAQSVLEELINVSRLGYKEVFFRDEIFTISKNRVLEICEGILEKNLDITWICSARIGSVDFEMIKMMKRAGCHMIRFGVESGVQGLLDNIKKGITIEEIRQTFSWAHKAKIDTHAHMMIGIPGETKDTLKTTVRFVKQIDPTIVTFGILTPYAGTSIFNELKQKFPEVSDGTSCDLSRLHTYSFYNEYFTDLSPEELSGYIRKVYRSFYLRPGYIFKWLKRMSSLDEFKRVILAGTQVFSFSFGGE